MRNIKTFAVLIFTALFFSIKGMAQTAKPKPITPPPPDNSANIAFRVYQQAVGLGDFSTAINSVHNIIATDPAKNAGWADTLALLYLQAGAYRQAYIISNQLLPGGYTELRMQVKAISAKNLQQPIEAIDAYKTLFDKTSKPGFGFELLQLEYGIRRLAESVATGKKLLQAIQPGDSSMVTIAKLDGKTTQEVTFKASVHNLLGLAYIDLKDKDNALLHLNEALKENPDFEQAKNNLSMANALAK